jgi:hypothetical protein
MEKILLIKAEILPLCYPHKIFSSKEIWWIGDMLTSAYDLGLVSRENLKAKLRSGVWCMTTPNE